MSIEVQLKTLQTQTETDISNCQNSGELETIRTAILGKKGALTDILKGIGQVAPEDRPKIGQVANAVKTTLSELIDSKLSTLQSDEMNRQLVSDTTDVTLPAPTPFFGKRHPINQTINDIVSIFRRLGFSTQYGPDMESEYYNFEALNIPATHSARDMHDTFYVAPGTVLRTHTSPVQIRTMESQKPPIKIIVPGKVYRCDADVTHSPMFHQIEGLYVDEHVTFSQLKGTLEFFLQEVFGHHLTVRFRPSYFPFTEPSTEVDVQCVHCVGKGCSLCKQTGWLEILGAGMVNRQVFRAVGYDPDAVTGFAFGLGIERIAMLKYAISDIRLFYENDLRFLRQF